MSNSIFIYIILWITQRSAYNARKFFISLNFWCVVITISSDTMNCSRKKTSSINYEHNMNLLAWKPYTTKYYNSSDFLVTKCCWTKIDYKYFFSVKSSSWIIWKNCCFLLIRIRHTTKNSSNANKNSNCNALQHSRLTPQWKINYKKNFVDLVNRIQMIEIETL